METRYGDVPSKQHVYENSHVFVADRLQMPGASDAGKNRKKRGFMPTDLPPTNNQTSVPKTTTRPPQSPPPGDSGSFRLLRVAGIPVRLHWTFLMLLAWLAFTGVRGAANSWQNVLFVLALFLCVALHELGHALVARRYGIVTQDITLYPIGGVARLENLPRPRQELWIALAGPAVNLVIGLALYGVALAGKMPLDFANAPLLVRLMWANLSLAVFNLVPAFPMDGGRVLRALLARVLDEGTATALAARIGQVLAIGVGVFGLLRADLFLVLIALFVHQGAAQEAAAFQTKALITGHRVREAMLREFHTLTVGNTLREAADMLLAGSQHDFPVVHGRETVGLLARSDLLRGIASEGLDAYVAGAMQRDFAQVSPEDDLEMILPLIQESGPILVMQTEEFPPGAAPSEQLVGMLTQENLYEFMLLTQLQMRPQLGREAR